MPAQVARWGHSLAVRVPRPLAEAAHLEDGSPVELSVEGGRLIITPAEPQLDALVAAITPGNRHDEVDWGAPEGGEAW